MLRGLMEAAYFVEVDGGGEGAGGRVAVGRGRVGQLLLRIHPVLQLYAMDE